MLDLKKIDKKILIGICIVFALAVWTAAYLACSSSDAYKKASEFILSNTAVSDKVGKILKSRLGFYNFMVSENLKNGSAEFSVVVSGEKANVDVYFILTKNLSTEWVVRKATLITENENLSLLENP